MTAQEARALMPEPDPIKKIMEALFEKIKIEAVKGGNQITYNYGSLKSFQVNAILWNFTDLGYGWQTIEEAKSIIINW